MPVLRSVCGKTSFMNTERTLVLRSVCSCFAVKHFVIPTSLRYIIYWMKETYNWKTPVDSRYFSPRIDEENRPRRRK